MRTTHSSSRLRGSARQRPPSRFFEALARFLFGPPPSVPLDERSLVAMLRGHDGAVAPADVMRVTGLDRAGAEAVLCRGLARHGGRIEVRGDAVVYRLRPRRWGTRPTLPPVWERPLPSPAVTGNRPAIDLLLALVNVMLVCLSAAALDRLTAGGPWWALAVPPLAFSIASLALPFGRLLGRAAERRRLARESGRRRLLRAVLERPAGGALQAYWLSHAWIEAAGHAIPPAALAEELRAFGGEADVDAEARLQFQFPDLDREARALAAERRPSRRLSPARVGA